MPPSYGKELRCSPQLLEDERLAEGSRHRHFSPSIRNRSSYISLALVNLKGKALTAFVYACLHPCASLCSRARACLQPGEAGDDRATCSSASRSLQRGEGPTFQQTISKHVRNNDKTTRPHMERPLRHATSRRQTHERGAKSLEKRVSHALQGEKAGGKMKNI